MEEALAMFGLPVNRRRSARWEQSTPYLRKTYLLRLAELNLLPVFYKYNLPFRRCMDICLGEHEVDRTVRQVITPYLVSELSYLFIKYIQHIILILILTLIHN